MKSQDDFELRILRGIHAGARAILPDQAVILGSDAECDFVLSDDGVLARHLQIQPSADGFSFVWLNSSENLVDENTSHLTDTTDLKNDEQSQFDGDHLSVVEKLEPGTVIAIGHVLLAVQARNSPWPDAKDLQVAPVVVDPNLKSTTPNQQDEESLSNQEAMTAAQITALASAEKFEDEKLVDALALGREDLQIVKPWRRIRFVIAGISIVSSLLLIFIVLFMYFSRSSSPVLPANNTPNVGVDDHQKMVADISDIVKAANIESRVTVSLQSDGRMLVKAVFLTDNEAEALGFSLTRIKPLPALEIRTEAEISQSLQDEVDRQVALLAQTSSTKLEKFLGNVVAVNLGGGLFRLDGRVADSLQREQLLKNLQVQFPDPIKLESSLSTPMELTNQIILELQANDFAEISGEWINDEAQIKASLAASDLPRWEQLLLRIDKLFKLPFKVVLDVKATKPVKEANLPFQLQSIVGGVSPYVVLQGGTKLMPDGLIQGWRLVSVNPTNVIFENVAGRRISVVR